MAICREQDHIPEFVQDEDLGGVWCGSNGVWAFSEFVQPQVSGSAGHSRQDSTVLEFVYTHVDKF